MNLFSQEVPLTWYLLLSAVLFSLGVLGFLIKRKIGELVKAGVAFDIHGFVVQPRDGVLIILAIGATFFGLCVNQFRKADFSRVTVFKRGHHR